MFAPTIVYLASRNRPANRKFAVYVTMRFSRHSSALGDACLEVSTRPRPPLRLSLRDSVLSTFMKCLFTSTRRAAAFHDILSQQESQQYREDLEVQAQKTTTTTAVPTTAHHKLMSCALFGRLHHASCPTTRSPPLAILSPAAAVITAYEPPSAPH